MTAIGPVHGVHIGGQGQESTGQGSCEPSQKALATIDLLLSRYKMIENVLNIGKCVESKCTDYMPGGSMIIEN